MKKRVALLHTSLVFINVVPTIKEMFEELMPDVEVVDFIDATILADLQSTGQIDASHVKRMTHLAQAAEDSGAEVIFSLCSSLGPTIDYARQTVDTDIIKIDDAMASVAVEKASNIGVLATVMTTLGPTIDLIKSKGEASGKQIKVVPKLAEGAFDILMAGDQATHDQMVLEAAQSISDEVDLLVFAQASMTRLAPMVSDATGLEVLTSPRLGVESVKIYLEQHTR
jgi:Asp/Glu/hydantoin racemase